MSTEPRSPLSNDIEVIDDTDIHSSSLGSLLYTATSKFLHQVFEDDKQKHHKKEFDEAPSNSFYSFLYGLASGSEESKIKESPSEPVDNQQTGLFNAAELSEFDFKIDKDVQEMNSHKSNADSLNATFIPKVKSEVEYEDPVLDQTLSQLLHPFLPPIIKESNSVDLLFSIDRNGISLRTMYRNVEDKGPVLLVIRDDQDQIFGAFVNESLHPQEGFYGNGESFLWKYSNGQVKAFKATGKNDYYILSEWHCVAFGGGQGHFGLWIDDQLYHGHSEPCSTFNNEELSLKREFCVNAFEVWNFVA